MTGKHWDWNVWKNKETYQEIAKEGVAHSLNYIFFSSIVNWDVASQFWDNFIKNFYLYMYISFKVSTVV